MPSPPFRNALGDAELSSLASVLRDMDRDSSLRTLASSPIVTSPTMAMGGSLFASAVLSPTGVLARGDEFSRFQLSFFQHACASPQVFLASF